MKILFISNKKYDPHGFLDYNIPDVHTYILAALAKRRGCHSKVADALDPEFALENMVEKAHKFDVVYIPATTSPTSFFFEAVGKIKSAYPQIPVIIGLRGTHLSEENIPADYLICGEEEKTLEELLQHLKKSNPGIDKINGLKYYDNNRNLIENKPRTTLRDKHLEQLPFPLFEELPEGVYDCLAVETARGRPFYSPILKSRFGSAWKFISSTGIFERLYNIHEHHVQKAKSKNIFIQDEYFTGKTKRLYDLAKLMKKKKKQYKITYRSRCSDFLNEDIAPVIRDFTAQVRFYPICGHNKGLRQIKKGFDTTIIKDCAKTLFKNGMNKNALFCFMTGHHWETPAQAEMTVDFAQQLKQQFGVMIKISCCDQ